MSYFLNLSIPKFHNISDILKEKKFTDKICQVRRMGCFTEEFRITVTNPGYPVCGGNTSQTNAI